MAAEQQVRIALDSGPSLVGDLNVPDGAVGAVLFAHGTGSGRRSPRNRAVAAQLGELGLATLLPDLLTDAEEAAERLGARLRFDIGVLAGRLGAALDRLTTLTPTAGLPVGLFGASTGAAAALAVAARRPDSVAAVVSRGGRPDLAGPLLGRVVAPTLLIVGGRDTTVLQLNRDAAARLAGPSRLEVVDGATHLFEEPGALTEVAGLAGRWFAAHLGVGAALP